MRKVTQALLRLSHKAGWVALLSGLVLQFGIKDRLPGLDLLFYAMPKPCLLALAVALLIWPYARFRSRFLATLVGVFMSWSWAASSWRAEPSPVLSTARDESQELRILYWNLCRPSGVHTAMVEKIKAFQPHIAAFVEPGEDDMEKVCREYENLLPGYQATWTPLGILWLSRVPNRQLAKGQLEHSGAYAKFEIEKPGPAFPVIVADVFPHPFHPRKEQLQELLELSQGRSDIILMGDFNTPLESVFLKGFRERFSHALEEAGQGFKETWPLGLPLLSLDHLWLGHDWETVEAQKVWSIPQSDHAALLVTLRRKAK